MLTKEQFIYKLSMMRAMESDNGTRYTNLHVSKKLKTFLGTRVSSGTCFSINIDKLYDAYLHCPKLTSPELKKYFYMGHSPALVVLKRLRGTHSDTIKVKNNAHYTDTC